MSSRVNNNILENIELNDLIPGQKYIIIIDDIDRYLLEEYDNKMFKFDKKTDSKYYFTTFDNIKIGYDKNIIKDHIFKLNLPTAASINISGYLGGRKTKRMRKSKRVKKSKKTKKIRK